MAAASPAWPGEPKQEPRDEARESAAPDARSPLPGGFSSRGLVVPRASIVPGGPGRDGIPSVDSPRFVSVPEAERWVRGEHAVVGVALEGEARAYPVHLLEHHQVVNDRFGDTPVLVTYDPLIDVARAYRVPDVEAAGEIGPPPATGFGVSGLIYRCNFVLFDRRDDSLWTQFDGLALTGARAGTRLEPLVVRVEPLRTWKRRHADTRVLRPPDPRHVDYRYSPYTSYWISDKIPFPVEHRDPRIHPKELVLGARVGDRTRAYLATLVERRGGRIVDELAGHRIRIEWDAESGSFSWTAPDEVELVSAYWFAWKNFHPDTELWNVRFEPTEEAEEADGGALPRGRGSGAGIDGEEVLDLSQGVVDVPRRELAGREPVDGVADQGDPVRGDELDRELGAKGVPLHRREAEGLVVAQ